MHRNVSGLTAYPFARRVEIRAGDVRARIFRGAHRSGVSIARTVLPADLRIDRSARHVGEDFVFARLVDGSRGVHAGTREERGAHSGVHYGSRGEEIREDVRSVAPGVHLAGFLVCEVHALSVQDRFGQVRRNGYVETCRRTRLERRSRSHRVDQARQDVLIRGNVISGHVCHVAARVF